MSTQPIPYRRNVPLGVISIELASEALKNEYKGINRFCICLLLYIINLVSSDDLKIH